MTEEEKKLSEEESACQECAANQEGKENTEEAIGESLKKAETEIAALKDTLLRTAAEYDNYRRRTQKEKDGAFANGVAFAAVELLPVLDVLEMAATAPTEDENYKKGVLLTLEKYKAALETLGITEINPIGEMFDPNLHAAVSTVGEGAEGTVSAVLQKGYKLNEKVLRHAAVAVAGG